METSHHTRYPPSYTGCTKDWNQSKWSFQAFYDEYKDCKFKVGEDDDGYKLRVHFKYYLEYLIYNKDDSPLYLFESSLHDHKQAKAILQNYQVPAYFRDDLFKLAGERRRPPYQW
jgi:histone arginine demethylase JMJD6